MEHANRQTVPVLQKMYHFFLWLIHTVEKFPKSQTFLLADRLQALTLDVHELLIEATYSSEKHAACLFCLFRGENNSVFNRPKKRAPTVLLDEHLARTPEYSFIKLRPVNAIHINSINIGCQTLSNKQSAE